MSLALDPRKRLDARLERRGLSLLDARTTLRHFALITYALPKERLLPHIPSDRYDIPEFDIGGKRLALLSVVPFLDVDFHFPRLLPWPRLSFYQTNHRVYIVDRATGEPAVWFFGTNLGSRVVHIPQALWRIPWHYTRYSADCAYDEARGRYGRYVYDFESRWCRGEIELEDTGLPVETAPGFSSLDELKLILTHPVRGFYYRPDGSLGTYEVWHPEMTMTQARAKRAYFSLYEDLGLLSREEMAAPHSVFLTPRIDFEIHLPPRAIARP